MANWKQVQGRIRKARGSADPAAQLTELFEKTRDGMVAFELAKVFEKSGQNDEAARWYTTAGERFRRADWKKKASEAVERLTGHPAAPAADSSGEVAPEEALPEQTMLPMEMPPAPDVEKPVEETTPEAAPRGKRRHRGRRGGRGRRRPDKKLPAAAAASPEPPPAAPAPAPEPPRRFEQEPAVAPPVRQPRERIEATVPRTGDPAMSSRMAQLEMQLRRLIASPLHSLDEADLAPAGPGVLLLSDSDQATHYYVEACRTIRIAVGHLLHAERGKRGESSFRRDLAEHLGITEARVSRYLKEHCAVRWLQLDEGASHLAHFAVAILRPALNE